MIGLYLIAAHLVGDFVLQNRWQAAEKLHSRRMRIQHVYGYVVPFVPLVAWQTWGGPWSAWHAQRGVLFLALLWTLHYLTDSRRFLSTLGDVVQWRFDARADPLAVKKDWLAYVVRDLGHGPRAIDVSDETVRWPTPNPWPPTALMVDQTLHVCQIALLGGLLLS